MRAEKCFDVHIGTSFSRNRLEQINQIFEAMNVAMFESSKSFLRVKCDLDQFHLLYLVVVGHKSIDSLAISIMRGESGES